MQLRLRSLNVERAYTLFFCWEEVIVTVTELAPMTSSFLVPAPSRSAPASAPMPGVEPRDLSRPVGRSAKF